jgi:glycosyltransferase involved in cell wall biosynthesis
MDRALMMSPVVAGRVSIVIPCFNAGECLKEAVQSALEQTHDDIEIIIVDDGSSEERTLEILATSKWPKTTVLRQANGGPSVARNRGVTAATGEYILPLDADDRIHSSYAAKAVAALKGHANVGIVYCKAQKFGVEEGVWKLPPYTLNELVIDNVIFCTGLYRKSDWSLVGGYNESLRHGMEDYEFWIKLVHLGRDVHQLDELLFFYRVQKNSRTTSFMANNAIIVSTYADIFRANKEFFAANAELLFEHRFRLCDELNRYRLRYGKIEALLARHQWLRKLARRIYKFIQEPLNAAL